MAVMAVRVRSRARAIKVLLCFIGALALLAMLMSKEVWWFDAAYVGVAYGTLLALSVRTLFSKWRSSEGQDVTKHGPMAAYPVSWRRWVTDDYPGEKDKERQA